MVEVGFPMLYRPFFSSQVQYQQFVDFYTQVAASVRTAGLKLIVENEFLLSNDPQDGWGTGAFYATLNWTQYQQARAQTAQVVAQTMHPDYMVVLQEPDTEASMTGHPEANTVSGATAMLTQILSAVQQVNATGIKVGAGVGSWHAQYLQFTQSFVTLPLDFIDRHSYWAHPQGGYGWQDIRFEPTSTLIGRGLPTEWGRPAMARPNPRQTARRRTMPARTATGPCKSMATP